MKKIASTLAGITLLGGLVGISAGPADAVRTAAECTSHDVAVRYRHTDDGAGHRYGRIVMTNVSDHACRSGGFGGLSYVGFGDGTQVGAAADRRGGASSFTLLPGEHAASR